VTREEAIEIMRSAGSRSIPYLQRHLRVSYDEAITICKLLDEPKEVVFLRPFQKGMACPECLKVYSKWHKVCLSCPDEKVRAFNAAQDRHLKRIGLIR
jgi:hypothetical protein